MPTRCALPKLSFSSFFFSSIYFLVFLNSFDMLMLKLNLKKKHYFDAFPSQKHFKKQLLP
jgi:ssDNA-specific exonuclease RecJ